MRTNIYLRFNGNCEEAFNLYAGLCGGRIETMQRYENSPAQDQVPAAQRKQVLHARLKLGDAVIMGSDAPPGRYQVPNGFSVSLTVETPADAERIFKTLSEKGAVQMPMAETFFAKRFGMMTDRFGTPWMVLCQPEGG
ncbi:MAG TPA: VOC family protein [Rhizomicrobium sp.]|nr:VOC family protein [Rhizomicrobium sp.]